MSDESEELSRLLGLPDLRVWSGDPEFVYENTRYYAATLRDLASISRGAFLPDNIEETWIRNESIVIRISMILENKPASIFVMRRGDFLDFCFLHRVNRLIENTPYRFELLHQTNPLIVALSSEEKRRVEETLGWRFETFTEDRVAQFLLAPIESRLSMKDYDGIIADLTQEIHIAPAHPELFYYRGIAFYERSQRAEAHADWAAAAASHGLTAVYERVRQRYGPRAFG